MSDQKPSSSHEPPSTSVGNGGIVAELPDGVGFAAVPLLTCPHLRFVERIPEFGINAQLPCATCNDLSENWICLTCYTVNCSRFVNEHALQHYNAENHPMTLSFSDLSVWCYVCGSYVHNEVLVPAKNMAYASKFGRHSPHSH